MCPGILPPPAVNGLIQVPKLDGYETKLYSFDEVSLLLSAEQSGLEKFPPSLYNSDLGLYPKRIAVVDTDA
jgi:hypothetical protein